jgi:elongation factor P
MIDVNDLRKGVTFEMDGNLFKVMEYSFNKPGRGNATIRIKARDLRSGSSIERTFISGNQVKDIRLDYHNVQYLYHDELFYYFMDLETYEQTVVNKLLIKDVAGFMKEEMEVKLTIYNDEPIDIELPVSVDLKVIEAENAVRGDTATGVTKKVKLETGAEVSVPYFINTGDTIRVDTRNGGYVTRVTN